MRTLEYQGTREQTVPGPETVSHPSAAAPPPAPPVPDTASDVVRWAAFSCVLVPVVLVWFGTSLAGATGTALGLAAVTGACRVLLRRSERVAARLRAEEPAPPLGRPVRDRRVHDEAPPGERNPGARGRSTQHHGAQDPGDRARSHGSAEQDRDPQDRDPQDRDAHDQDTRHHDTEHLDPQRSAPRGNGPREPRARRSGAQDMADSHIMNGLQGSSGVGAQRGGRHSEGKKPVD